METLAQTQLTPFSIHAEREVLNDLQYRLAHTRWPNSLENMGWNYGTNSEYLKELVDYWQKDFDWKAQEESLNQYPQFKETIEGMGIHFLYIKGKGENSRPLILTHGWPDSFYRFYKVINLLTKPESGRSFDLVIPSVPGFGFSDLIPQDQDQTARLWNKLMVDVLGCGSYFAAGGDWGSLVTKSLANQFPERVRAIHLTDVGYPDGTEDWSKMTPAEQEFGQFIQQWFFSEGAFNMIQSTKPQTLGYGLNDSPVGLAAWIIEKFYGWSDCNGNIENSFTKDELLTNVMIYWITQTINSSARAYKVANDAVYSGSLKYNDYVEVPTGIALFPGEAPFPKEWADRKVNVQRFQKMERGGHFAAMEVPELWAGELQTFFSQY